MRLRWAIAAFVASTSSAIANCAPERVDIRGDWGSARFSVEVADDPAERSQGLMNRPSMATGAGMLFVYEQPQRAVFWMKNTLIPLDMLFIDANASIARIHKNAVPMSEAIIESGQAVVGVLELNGGSADYFGIKNGDKIIFPAG